LNIDDILNKDTMMEDVEEIRNFVANKFDEIDTLILLWETKDGEVHHRGYGNLTSIVGLLSKAEFIMLREDLGDTKEKER